MAISLEFLDRNTRIHFECTVQKHCALKASLSLPKLTRKIQSAYLTAVSPCHPGVMAMIRLDTAEMSFVAYLKEESGNRWTRFPGLGSNPIP
jgi:hypothetical protein